ncbi:hypothetical protein PP613_03915 [Mycobacteroides abscessus]|nr:hypothetical protein [Mycobacteroides abscessus]MDM2408496.1 hypothetical protein [Mycobacteroides abscessus]
MPEVSEHVVTAATWEYLTPSGTRRRAFFGETVRLTDDEVERGLKIGALGVELPAESTDGDSDAVEADADDGDTGSGDGGDGDPSSTADDSGDPGEDTSTEGGPEGHAPPEKPLKAATKPVLVDWLMANGAYDRGELEDQDKADLWALIEATD